MDEKKVREAIYCMKSFVDEAVCEECDYYETCDHTRAEENANIAIWQSKHWKRSCRRNRKNWQM